MSVGADWTTVQSHSVPMSHDVPREAIQYIFLKSNPMEVGPNPFHYCKRKKKFYMTALFK